MCSKSKTFWVVTPCSLLRCNRCFGGTYCLHLQGRRKFQQEPASKQVASRSAICSSETSVACQQTTRRHIPEDDSLHNHRCENLKSYLCVRSWLIICFCTARRNLFVRVNVQKFVAMVIRKNWYSRILCANKIDLELLTPMNCRTLLFGLEVMT
jgi:hypothetical protein